MGGLFVGSLGYARVVPARWNPLRTYAIIELMIAGTGVAMPFLIGWLRAAYLEHATSPGMALTLRTVLCAGLLLPPTVLMGATLPALARWVRADERQAASIGRLYAANLLGAVAGTLGSALVLLPTLGLLGTNLVAVGLSLLVAGVAATMRGSYASPRKTEAPDTTTHDALPVYMAYALNGMAALSFEVVWTRLLSMVLGSTVYAFSLVLGVFLLALGFGSAVGSALGPRLARPRRAFATLQLGVAAAVGTTPVLVSLVPLWFVDFDARHADDPWLLTLTNLLRVTVVVFPGAFLWGMAFPLALVSLGRDLGDAARPVGRLYAFNTVGSVLGALAASFVLIPAAGSSTAAAHLILVPLAATAVLLLPSRPSRWALATIGVAVVVVVYFTSWPSDAAAVAQVALARGREAPWLVQVLIAAAAITAALSLVRRPHGWGACAAAVGTVLALCTSVPDQLYMLGRSYGSHPGQRRGSEILLIEEGALEPVVVFRAPDRSLQISISGKVCASTNPTDMVVQRLLGHLPVLLSADPSRCLVVGLGAGITAGAVAVHDSVGEVDVVELERRVEPAARLFAEANYNVLDSGKVRLVIDDGRHWVATTDRTYGVITSDPIEPYLAGAAALYTVEYYEACRSRLVDGGVFVQFMGMAGMDEPGVRSLLAAFAQVFPGGSIWITRYDVVMVGTKGPERVDLESIRARLASDPTVAASLAEVGLRSAEDVLACRLCSCQSLSEYLRGATPNSDDRLTIQYTGWRAFYRFYNRDVSHIRRLFESLRERAPRPGRSTAGGPAGRDPR
jgi:spermidine synthase